MIELFCNLHYDSTSQTVYGKTCLNRDVSTGVCQAPVAGAEVVASEPALYTEPAGGTTHR